MLKKIVSWTFSLLFALALAVFLVANRRPVAISLDPLNAAEPAIETFALPLWLWLVSALLFGFFLGALGMWASGAKRRQKAREDRLAITALRKENEILAARSTREAPLLVADA